MKNYTLLLLFFILINIPSVQSKSFTKVQRDTLVNNIQTDTIISKNVLFYINQPFGFINKLRIKLGYRYEDKSKLLFSFVNYNMPSVEGTQVGAEYQYVLKGKSKHENFVYGKAAYGTFKAKTSGDYLLIGIGIGQEYFLNKSKTLSLQINEGLKACKVIHSAGVLDDDLFMLWNPGFIVDLNFNLGLRF